MWMLEVCLNVRASLSSTFFNLIEVRLLCHCITVYIYILKLDWMAVQSEGGL